MNILDIVLVIIVALSILFGIIKGFTRELLSLAFFIIAVVLAFLFYYEVGSIYMSVLKDRDASNFAGFITIFVLVLTMGAVVTYFVKKIFTIGPLKAIDMIWGGLFGLFRGILIASIIVFALIVYPVNANLVVKSRLSPYIIKGIDVLVRYLPAEYKEKIGTIKKN